MARGLAWQTFKIGESISIQSLPGLNSTSALSKRDSDLSLQL
jgi:hypothetical protein